MTVSNQIIEVLNALCDKFGLVIDWSSQNILPYMQELTTKIVNYEFWTSIAWILTFSFLAIIFFIIGNILTHTSNFHWYEDSPKTSFALFCFIMGGIFLIIFIFVLINQTFDIITCLTFPEKTVVNFISSTMNSLNN